MSNTWFKKLRVVKDRNKKKLWARSYSPRCWSWSSADRDKRPEQLQHLKHEQRTLCSLSSSERKHQGNPLPRHFPNCIGFSAWEWTLRPELVDVDLQWNPNQFLLFLFFVIHSCWGKKKKSLCFIGAHKSAFSSLLFNNDHLHRQIGFGISTVWTRAPAAYITGVELRKGLGSSSKVLGWWCQAILALVLSRQHLHLQEWHTRGNIFPSLQFFWRETGSGDVVLRETKRHPQNYKSALLACLLLVSDRRLRCRSHLYTTTHVFWSSVQCTANTDNLSLSLPIHTCAHLFFFFFVLKEN